MVASGWQRHDTCSRTLQTGGCTSRSPSTRTYRPPSPPFPAPATPASRLCRKMVPWPLQHARLPRACSERSPAAAFPGGPSLCSGPSPRPDHLPSAAVMTNVPEMPRDQSLPDPAGSAVLWEACVLSKRMPRTSGRGTWQRVWGLPTDGTEALWSGSVHTRLLRKIQKPSRPCRTPRKLSSLTGPLAEARHFHIQGGTGFPAVKRVP